MEFAALRLSRGLSSLAGRTRLGTCALLFLLLSPIVGHSWVGYGYRWFEGDLPLHMRLGLGASIWTDAAVDALRAWNGAGARFQFRWGQYAGGSLSCGGPDSRREVVFAARHCDDLEWGSTVGIAQFWYRGSQMVDADVAFDAGRSWDVYYGRRRFAIDFRRVAMHEFGHVLGLDHPDDHGQVRTAIMNSSVSDTDRLQSDDISGIRAVYGSDRPRGGAPDLVVESLRTSPGTLTAGQAFTLSATVRNAGSGTAAGTTLRYYYYRSSGKEWVVVGTDRVGSLSGSASSAESIRLTAPSGAGTHYYNACVASVAGETQRENCAGSLRVTVTAGGGGAPDLEVESLRTSPGTLTARQTFTLSATVRNVGIGTAAATTLRYYYYQSGAKDWEVVGTDPVGSLSGSASSAESIRLTAPSGAGTHYYNACVASVAGETRRENCSGNLRVTVTAGEGGAPDLVVESLRTSPVTLTAGETFTLSATVRNVGVGTATATTLRYHYYRSSSKEWVVVGQDSVRSLAPGAGSAESIRLTVPGRAGTHWLSACVAPVAGETNRKNCSTNLRVTVRGS